MSYNNSYSSSYSNSYSNINGEEKYGEKEIMSDGKKTKVYRNINGHAEIEEIQGIPYSRHFNHTASYMIEQRPQLRHILNGQNELPLIKQNNNSSLPSIDSNSVKGNGNFFDDFNTSFNDPF